MTKIEWTHRPGTKGETWNPIVGCSIVSPGCTHCYAMRMAARIEAMNAADNLAAPSRGAFPHYVGTTQRSKAGPVWTGKVALAPEHILTAPLRAAKPRTYFVNSMGDIFHEDVPDEWIDHVFAIMALCPQHTFLVLTKRAARMRAYLSSPGLGVDIGMAAGVYARLFEAEEEAGNWVVDATEHLPLPNVWLGVSAEDQRRADERIPDLLATPAAIRFVSAEPLLGPVDFAATVYHDAVGISHKGWLRDKSEPDDNQFHSHKLDWVIVGGESGRDARPMHPDWARSLRDQCAAAGTAFFFKQWGEWLPVHKADATHAIRRDSGQVVPWPHGAHGDAGDLWEHVMRVGKARAGHLLDGIEHFAWPIPAPAPEAVA